MANPLYGQNKQDDLLDALASADDNIVTSATGSGQVGQSTNDAPAVKAIPVTIDGVKYYIALYAVAKVE